MNTKKDEDSNGSKKILAENRKARFNFHILETFEAGLVLMGHEIKSIRGGGANIGEAYIRPQNGEIYLIGAHFKPYGFTKHEEIDPLRPRKLLLHKAEIVKLHSRVAERGFTIVPLELYLKNGRAKILIAIAKGKNAPDKRASIKDKDAARAIARAMKR